MAKTFTFIIVVTTMMFILSMLGMIDGTTRGILDALSIDNPENFKFGEFFSQFFNIFTISGAAVGLIVGATAYYLRDPESAIMALVVSTFGGWVLSDMVAVISATGPEVFGTQLAWVSILIRFIMVVMMAGFVIAIISWWRGND